MMTLAMIPAIAEQAKEKESSPRRWQTVGKVAQAKHISPYQIDIRTTL